MVASRRAPQIAVAGGRPLAHLTAVNRVVTKFLRDPQELVIFRDPIGPAKRAGLDLPGVGRDRDVGNGRVLGLAGAMTDHGGVIVLASPRSIAAKVSVSVPIWFTFTRMELATPCAMPLRRKATLVTKRSSPTSCVLSPSRSVNFFQPSQSFSAQPSSIEMIGKRRAERLVVIDQLFRRVRFEPSDFLKT